MLIIYGTVRQYLQAPIKLPVTAVRTTNSPKHDIILECLLDLHIWMKII